MTDVNMYTVTIMKQWIMVKPESMIQLYKKTRGKELILCVCDLEIF